MPVYQHQAYKLSIDSPSEIGGSAEIKPINFDHKTKASDTGNLYHKLTELLPSADWTAELIEETGKRLYVTIPSGIPKNLIALNGNEIFRSTVANDGSFLKCLSKC